MGSVGNDDFFARIAALAQTGANQHQAGELALCARGRLQAHVLHAAHFGKHLLELEEQRQRALQMLGRRHWMKLGEAGQTRHDFVDLGIVLHRARAQRVELALDGEVALRQAG